MRNPPVTFAAMEHQLGMGLELTTCDNKLTSLEFRNWSAIPLRLIVGYGFVAHGYAKLARGPEHFFTTLQRLNVPAPYAMGWATIMTELLGGLAVLAGAFVPWASLPVAAVLAPHHRTADHCRGESGMRRNQLTGTNSLRLNILPVTP